MIDPKTKRLIIAAIRKVSFFHKQNREALKRCMDSEGNITCEGCGAVLSSKKEVNRDHIKPLVPLTGWDTWDGYINRAFPGAKGIQILCKSKCHAAKTKKENSKRKKG